jgi:hypothetical protein
VGAPPRDGEVALPLSYAQGRRSQSDGRPRRDGWSLRCTPRPGSTPPSPRSRRGARRTRRPDSAPASPPHARPPSGSRTAGRRRRRRCARSTAACGRSLTRAAAAPPLDEQQALAGDPDGESPRPGRAKSCCGPSTPRSARRQPAPRWTACYRWQTASGWRTCHGLPAPSGSGRPKILAFHSAGGCSNGPTEAVNLLIKKVKQVGRGFPQLRQLPPTAATTLRRHVADSPHRKTARPLPTLGGVEPPNGPLIAVLTPRYSDDPGVARRPRKTRASSGSGLTLERSSPGRLRLLRTRSGSGDGTRGGGGMSCRASA